MRCGWLADESGDLLWLMSQSTTPSTPTTTQRLWRGIDNWLQTCSHEARRAWRCHFTRGPLDSNSGGSTFASVFKLQQTPKTPHAVAAAVVATVARKQINFNCKCYAGLYNAKPRDHPWKEYDFAFKKNTVLIVWAFGRLRRLWQVFSRTLRVHYNGILFMQISQIKKTVSAGPPPVWMAFMKETERKGLEIGWRVDNTLSGSRTHRRRGGPFQALPSSGSLPSRHHRFKLKLEGCPTLFLVLLSMLIVIEPVSKGAC